MAVQYNDQRAAGGRGHSAFLVRCDHPGCWQAVERGVSGLPLSGVRDARRAATTFGWATADDLDKDSKDYCPDHRTDHDGEEGP